MANIDFGSAIRIWNDVKNEIGKVLVGQEHIINRLLLAITLQGHVLIEGLPGLAKTLTVNLLAKILSTSASRIQFTPDLLPADVTGTMIYDQKTKNFKPHKGPIFANMVIADEINRAPAKVQSALLQAMEERSVTLGDMVIDLPSPFVVMATQNPIEHEGTFELPEAQLDRFLFKLVVHYPNIEDEIEIVRKVDKLTIHEVSSIANLKDLLSIGAMSLDVNVDESIVRYIVQITSSTRNLGLAFGIPDKFIEYGASPRASLAIMKSVRVLALLNNRDYVIPDDVKNIVPDVLRHRVMLSYDALDSGATVDTVIKNILHNVSIPK